MDSAGRNPQIFGHVETFQSNPRHIRQGSQTSCSKQWRAERRFSPRRSARSNPDVIKDKETGFLLRDTSLGVRCRRHCASVSTIRISNRWQPTLAIWSKYGFRYDYAVKSWARALRARDRHTDVAFAAMPAQPGRRSDAGSPRRGEMLRNARPEGSLS